MSLPGPERASRRSAGGWRSKVGSSTSSLFAARAMASTASKPGKHCFPCFFHGPEVVITHGYKKEHQKMPRAEFERGAKIRAAYLEAGHADPPDPEDRPRPPRR